MNITTDQLCCKFPSQPKQDSRKHSHPGAFSVSWTKLYYPTCHQIYEYLVCSWMYVIPFSSLINNIWQHICELQMVYCDLCICVTHTQKESISYKNEECGTMCNMLGPFLLDNPFLPPKLSTVLLSNWWSYVHSFTIIATKSRGALTLAASSKCIQSSCAEVLWSCNFDEPAVPTFSGRSLKEVYPRV